MAVCYRPARPSFADGPWIPSQMRRRGLRRSPQIVPRVKTYYLTITEDWDDTSGAPHPALMWPLPSAAVVLIAAALVAAPRPAPPAGAAVDLLVDTVADPGAGGAVDGDEVEDCTDGIADGDCSLREALRYANADPALDRIGFGVPGGGVQTIAPAAALPAIADDGVTVDGYPSRARARTHGPRGPTPPSSSSSAGRGPAPSTGSR